MNSMDGIVFIDKPAGLSSFGVVKRVRWLLSQAIGKKVKVGHTGTLDPFATGLMIVVVGSYCKRASEFSKLDKTYQATMGLGQVSTTGDPEGALTPGSDRQPAIDEIRTCLNSFVGSIQQTPSAYSAIKIDGVRAYKLARSGQEVTMPARNVTIHSLRLVSYSYPEARIEATVSSGTYIRTLVTDIGEKLGTGAYTAQLRRLRVGPYDVAQAAALSELQYADDVQVAEV